MTQCKACSKEIASNAKSCPGCGAKNSKKIIAINSDKDAEIFKYADYKIVADAKKIIDDLIEYISK